METLVHCRCEIDLHQYETRMQILRRYNAKDREAQNWDELLQRLRKMVELEQKILGDLAGRLQLSAERLSIYRKLRLEDLELYAQVAEQLGLEADQVKARELLEERKNELAQMAAFDGETGLYHQRLGLRLLGEKIEEARRQQAPLAVLLLGPRQETSDPAFNLLARRLTELIRWGDLAAHYGARQFLLAWPSTEAPEARRMLSKIRTQAAGLVQGGLASVFTYPLEDEEELALLDRLEEAFGRLRNKNQFFQISKDHEIAF